VSALCVPEAQRYEQQGYKILPDAYIKPELLADQWTRSSAVSHDQTQGSHGLPAVQRLNSSSRQHPLYHALKEFGKIPKSDFLLRYTDILAVRQAVEKQLNKGESMNKLARAVSFGNNQEFLYGEKVEQEIAEGCQRLIKTPSSAGTISTSPKKSLKPTARNVGRHYSSRCAMARWGRAPYQSPWRV